MEAFALLVDEPLDFFLAFFGLSLAFAGGLDLPAELLLLEGEGFLLAVEEILSLGESAFGLAGFRASGLGLCVQFFLACEGVTLGFEADLLCGGFRFQFGPLAERGGLLPGACQCPRGESTAEEEPPGSTGDEGDDRPEQDPGCRTLRNRRRDVVHGPPS